MDAAADFIFLAVGTSLDPFDRLLRLVDDLRASGQIPAPVLAQSGHCRYTPRHLETVPFLPADQMEDRVHKARAVICHGGAGLIGTCLLARKRPVVFPRRVAHQEIVNDHQLELCQEMLAQGRIYLAHDGPGLLAAVRQALTDPPAPASEGGARLKRKIADLLAEIAARPR